MKQPFRKAVRLGSLEPSASRSSLARAGEVVQRSREEQWSVRIPVDDPAAATRLRAAVTRGLSLLAHPVRGVVVVCVGTDRSTGDALGPLTGHRLQAIVPDAAAVFGTLEHPVHAGNLGEHLARIRHRHPAHALVAVDACLGSLENVGTIAVGLGALRPGAGVNKTLPPVGDLYVTGVVNVGGFMEYFVLQNTRLHLVMKMATVVAEGLAPLLSGLEARRAADGRLPAYGPHRS